MKTDNTIRFPEAWRAADGNLLLHCGRKSASALATAASSLLLATGSFAEAVDDGAKSFLDEIVVTATRQEEKIFDVPVSVAVITLEDIQRTETNSFRDLFRYTPGVDVVRDRRSRAGEANVTIRGIGGRRVLLLVDGVRLPDGFGAAGVSDQSRGKLEMESLARAEIVRGPASALYGSDALGGIVGFKTKTPADILDEGSTLGVALAAGYDDAINGGYGAADFAARSGSLAGLLSLTVRDQSELENNDALGPDPQDIDGSNLLAKLTWTPAASQLLSLTGEHFRRDSSADRQSANVAVGPPPIRVFDDTLGDDRSERSRLGLSWQWAPDDRNWLDAVSAQVDYQDSETLEYTEFTVTTVGAGPPQSVFRDDHLHFSQEQWSSTGQVAFGPPDNDWLGFIAGYEWVRRDTGQRDEQSEVGISPPTPRTLVVEGNVYPQKLYPDTRSNLVGLFTQMKLDLFEGALTLLPGVRYDSYELDPRPDALFENANVLDFTPASLDESRVTPRVGITWRLSQNVSLFGNYAEGFRTPGAEQLNRIGRVPVATFVHDFLPNPELGPETSRGFEIGLRGEWQAFTAEISAYRNDFEDFIDTSLVAFIPAGSIGNPLTIRRFQSVNIDEVRLQGFEGKAVLDFGAISSALDGLSLTAVFSKTDGDDLTQDQPLNSTPPTQAVLGAAYDSPRGGWGAQLHATHVAERDDVAPISSRGIVVPHITQDSYSTLDLSAYVRMFGNTLINVQVTNLFDERYAEWPDLVNLPAGSAQADYFSAPGRAFSVSLRTRF